MSTQQAEAQFNYLQSLAARSIESTGKIIALNLSTARATMEQSSAAVRQLFSVKDPRDLLALTASTQQNFDSMLAKPVAKLVSKVIAQPAPAEPKQLDMLTPKPKASKKK